MPKQATYTKSDLSEKYPDTNWRARLLDLVHLEYFLSGCIIQRDYRIPDAMNQAINLTADGERILRELGKDGVPIKEARILCLLELAHVDILVDIAKMNIDEIAKAIHKQILDREIIFPFIWGPDLYQRAADMFQYEQKSIGITDTLRLLDGTPVGVFQAGPWISGPYGLVKSGTTRDLPPTRSVPLQHCHDVSCRRVHRTYLDTDYNAAINTNRSKIRRLLEEENDESSQWGQFIADLKSNEAERFDDQSLAILPLLIGEGFGDEELRTLFIWLMDETHGTYRKALAPLGLSGAAKAISSTLDRAQLFQLLLLADNKTLQGAIDTLVFAKQISVPDNEVRRPILHAGARSSAFHVRPELSPHGVRTVSDSELGPLRLKRLVDKMYPLNEFNHAEELDWQLRSVEGLTVGGRLEEYLRTESPEAVLRRLVLARRENVEVACSTLLLTYKPTDRDDLLLARLLWKLGFEPKATDELQVRFWITHGRIAQAARAATVSSIVDQEAMRGLSANYFVGLEELLDDTLAFSTWVLTTDHVAQARPYAYDPDRNRKTAYALLDAFAAEVFKDQEREAITYGDRNTLYPLVQGFGLLAKRLRELQLTQDQQMRSPKNFPDFVEHTTLQQFPFQHTTAFLDLTAESQTCLLSRLDEVSRLLSAANVSDVRNEQLHFRRSTADLDRLLNCLGSIESAVRILEDTGLTRVLFRPMRRDSDMWGRRTIYMTDSRGREIAFGRPASFAWLSFPSFDEPQYIVSGAQFAEPNEAIRIRPGADSEYARLWSNFPRRREANVGIGGAEMPSNGSADTAPTAASASPREVGL